MSETDIHTKIKNMLDEIPDELHDEHRREYSMSRPTARWMANMMLMIVESSGCNNGFSHEQAHALKALTPETIATLADMEKERKRVLGIVGAGATALGGGCLALMVYIGQKVIDASFWQKLFAKWGQP